MVSIRNIVIERMWEVEQMALLVSLQMQMDEMEKKNKEKIQALRKENEEMKKKLIKGLPSLEPSHPARTSHTTLPTNTLEDPTPIYPQETMDESHLNKSFYTTRTLDIARRPIH